MGRRDRTGADGRTGGRRRGCGCSLILLLVILAGLVVAAEFGLRWYLADRAEREVSAEIGAPVSVSFGSGILLWDIATSRSAETVHMTSPGSDTVPRLDVTGHSVGLVDGAIHVGWAEGTALLDEQQLLAAAAQGEPLQGLPVPVSLDIRSVQPDPEANVLRVDLGGIAQVGLEPGASDGTLTLTPDTTEIFGIPLPDGLFAGITAKVDSTVETLPQGVMIDGARVVPGGLEVSLGGRDVVLSRN